MSAANVERRDPLDLLLKASGPSGPPGRRKAIFQRRGPQSHEDGEQTGTQEKEKHRDEEGAIWEEDLLIGLIGDENTCVGFLLAGIGERSPDGSCNVVPVQSDTPVEQVAMEFQNMLAREDIAILLVTDQVSEMIPHSVARHLESRRPPVLVTIPSPYQPYDPEADVMVGKVRHLNASEGGSGEPSSQARDKHVDAEDFM